MKRSTCNIPLLIIALVLLPMILSSCSDRARAKRLVRQAYAKINKAEMLDPSSVDSIKGKMNVSIDIPGDTGSLAVKAIADTSAFDKALKERDSLKEVANSQEQRRKELEASNGDLAGYAIDLETKQDELAKVNAGLAKTNAALLANRSRLLRGFVRDTTYTLNDSLVIVYARISDGAIDSLWYVKKPHKVTKEVDTAGVNLNTSRPMWKEPVLWILVLIIAILSLLLVLSYKRK